jgi:cellobiose-specific phosphotransferase system component IIC
MLVTEAAQVVQTIITVTQQQAVQIVTKVTEAAKGAIRVVAGTRMIKALPKPLQYAAASIVIFTALSFLVAFLWPNGVTEFLVPLSLSAWAIIYRLISRPEYGP